MEHVVKRKRPAARKPMQKTVASALLSAISNSQANWVIAMLLVVLVLLLLVPVCKSQYRTDMYMGYVGGVVSLFGIFCGIIMALKTNKNWDAANAKGNAAIAGIEKLKQLGMNDQTAPQLADLRKQLDEANADLDRLESEAAQNKG